MKKNNWDLTNFEVQKIMAVMRVAKKDVTGLAIAIDFSPQAIYAVLGGKRKISQEMAERIHAAFPRISYNDLVMIGPELGETLRDGR